MDCTKCASLEDDIDRQMILIDDLKSKVTKLEAKVAMYGRAVIFVRILYMRIDEALSAACEETDERASQVMEEDGLLRECSILAGRDDKRTDEEDVRYIEVKRRLGELMKLSWPGRSHALREIRMEKHEEMKERIAELEAELFPEEGDE